MAMAGLIIAGTVWFQSCKKDDPAVPAPQPGSKISEIIHGNEMIRFTYHADGSLAKASTRDEDMTNGTVIDFTVSYNAARKIETIHKSDGEMIRAIYDGETLAIAEVYQDNVKIGHSEYEYLNGYLKSITLHIKMTGFTVPFMKNLFSYDGKGNISSNKLFLYDAAGGTLKFAGRVDYQYDDRPNPLYELNDFLHLIWQQASPNNIKEEVRQDENGELTDRVQYHYTYNGRNHPAKAALVSGLPGQPEVESEKIYNY
jgi:hypothetical protein